MSPPQGSPATMLVEDLDDTFDNDPVGPSGYPASMRLSQEDLDDGTAEAEVERCESGAIGALMNKAWRSPVTGNVQIKSYGRFQNFQVVDLFTRQPVIKGRPRDLAKDVYLFRPIPLMTRTWLYHHISRSGEILDSADEDALIRLILSQHCMDANVWWTGWSPAVLYIPMILFLSIAADLGTAIDAIVVLSLIFTIQWGLNSPDYYRFARLVHLPLRFYLLYDLIMAMSGKEEATALSLIGYSLAILFCTLEIVLGDGGMASAYRLHCHYEVLMPLPNRIFICRRHGAAHSKDVYGRCLPVSEKITGMGCWAEDFTLIADVQGLIVELRPMSVDCWKLLVEEHATHPDHKQRYFGMDIFAPGSATVDALNMVIKEQTLLNEKKKQAKDELNGLHVEDA